MGTGCKALQQQSSGLSRCVPNNQHVHAQVVALVGPSGGGKSSVVKLLQRFYLPSGGAVRLDGRDLGLYSPKWLKRHIGLVAQEPTLYSRSIYRYSSCHPTALPSLEAVINSRGDQHALGHCAHAVQLALFWGCTAPSGSKGTYGWWLISLRSTAAAFTGTSLFAALCVGS